MVRTRRGGNARQPAMQPARRPPARQPAIQPARRQPARRRQQPARLLDGAGAPANVQPAAPPVALAAPPLPLPAVAQPPPEVAQVAPTACTNGELLDMFKIQQQQLNSLSEMISSKLFDNTSATTSTVSSSEGKTASTAQPLTETLPTPLGQLNVIESQNIHVQGLPLGALLPSKIKDLIHNKKFVELALILKPESSAMIINFARDLEGNDSINLTPKVHKSLSEADWIKAFSILTAVHVEKFPLELNALLTYSQKVQSIMARGGDWNTFDRTFRKELAVTQGSFSTLRPDLEIIAYTNALAQKKPLNRPLKRHHPYAQSSRQQGFSHGVPKGKCFRFHIPSQFCPKSTEDCEYDHTCDKCGDENIHPRYRCGKSSSSNRQQRSRPSNPNKVG